jgi:hypothetical protein
VLALAAAKHLAHPARGAPGVADTQETAALRDFDLACDARAPQQLAEKRKFVMAITATRPASRNDDHSIVKGSKHHDYRNQQHRNEQASARTSIRADR